MKDITEYKRFCDVNANQEFWCDYIKYKKIGDYVAIELDTPKNIQSIVYFGLGSEYTDVIV